jgi:hypothetical protein
MAIAIHTLEPGTAVRRVLNLPTGGGWLGLVKVSLVTVTASASIEEWLFIYPNHFDGKIRYRRTGGVAASPPSNGFKNWTLAPHIRPIRWLAAGESLMTIKYTATEDISVCIETTRSIETSPYPAIPVSSGEANAIAVPGDPNNGVVYWKTS